MSVPASCRTLDAILDFEHQETPGNILSLIGLKYICSSFGSQLNIMSATTKECLSIINLDCSINTITMDPSETILVIADDLGTIHIVQLSTGQLVFSQVVTQSEIKDVKLMMDKDICELLIVLSNQLIRISNINIKAVQETRSSEEFTALVKDSIHVQFIETFSETITSAEGFVYHNSVRYLIIGSEYLSIWCSTDDGFIMIDTVPIHLFRGSVKKALVFSKDSLVLVLDSFSNLYFMDLRSCVVFKQNFMGHVKDIEAEKNVEFPFACINALYDLGNGNYVVKLLKVPSLKVIYYVDVYQKTKLIPSLVTQVPTTLLCFADNAWKLMEISGSNKMGLLRTFAKNGDWKQASAFIENDIDFDFYYEHRLSFLVSINEIIDCLENNYKIVVDFVLNHDTSDVTELFQLFQTAGKKIQNITDLDYISKLNRAKTRLGTYRFLLAKNWFSLWNDWKDFYNSNMLLNIQNVISTQNVTFALCLWRRHFKDENLLEFIPAILSDIPMDINIDVMLLILNEFYFSCQSAAGEVKYKLFAELDQWVYETALNIEQIMQKPEHALQLLQWSTRNTKQKEETCNLTPNLQINYLNNQTSKRNYRSCDVLEKIKTLIVKLQDIIELGKRHKFNISLSEYEKSTPTAIAIALLDRVHATELLEANVISHVVPFVTKHQLSLSNVLADYCKEMLESHSTSSAGVNHWESRILVIMNLIQETSFLCMVLLDSMRRSPIPWSSGLAAMISKVLSQLKHKLVDEIKEQLKLMKLKLMIQRYGIKNFNVSDVSLASRLIPFVLRNVESLEAIPDSFACIEAYRSATKNEVIVQRMQILISNSLLGRAESVIKNHSENPSNSKLLIDWEGIDTFSVLRELDIWISFKLERLLNKKDMDQEFLNYLKAGTIITGFLHSQDSKIQKNRVYERCISLFEESSIKITPALLDEPEFIDQLIDSKLEEIKTIEKMNITYRIGHLLGYSRSHLLYKTAGVMARKGLYENVFYISQELNEKFSNPESSQQIFTILLNLLHSGPQHMLSMKNASIASKVLLEMSKMAVKCSSSENLEMYLQYFKRMELLHRIVLQTEKGDYQNTLKNPNDQTDVELINPIFRNQYKEVGLVISAAKVIPLVFNFLFSLQNAESAVKGKGKGRDNSGDFTEMGFALAKECLSTRNYECCLRTCELLLEQCILKNQPVLDKFSEMYTETLTYLIQNQLNVEDIDYIYSLGVMLSLPKEKANVSFKNAIMAAGQNYNRLNQIARVGSAAGSVWNQRTFQVNCMAMAQHARWLQEFSILNIPCDEQLFKNTNDSAYHRSLIPYLLFKSGGDLELTLSFAEQFHIDSDYVYCQLILQDFIIKSNSNDDYVNRFSKLAVPITLIANKSLFAKFLSQCQAKISPYDYEALHFLNSAIVQIEPDNSQSKRNLLILDVLMNYTRINPPLEDELSQYIDPENDAGLVNLDKTWSTAWSSTLSLGKKRLPFHSLLSDPFSILSVELDDSNPSRILPLGKVLNVSTDLFYEKLIQNKVLKLEEQLKERKEHSVLVGYFTFYEFKPILSKIKDHALAISLAVFVGGRFPRGEERIAAYRMASTFSQKWITFLSESHEEYEKAKTASSKVKAMLNVAETEHALQLYGLQVLDKHVPKPTTLLTHLLTLDDSYPNMSWDTYHSIASDIAKRYVLDLDNIKLLLLRKWLTGETTVDMADKIDQDKYLFLLHGKFEWGVHCLKTFAQLPRSKISTDSRIKALAVLLAMFQLPEAKSKGFDPQIIEKQLRLNLYAWDLEKIQMEQPLKEFDSCDKHALVRSIWISKRNDAAGLQLICKIALDYEIVDYELWNNVLECLKLKGEHEYLLKLVSKLSDVSIYSNLESLNSLFRDSVIGCIKNWIKQRTGKGDFLKELDGLLYFIHIVASSRYTDEILLQELDELLTRWATEKPFVPLRYVVAIYNCERNPLNLDCNSKIALLNQNSEQIDLINVLDCLHDVHESNVIANFWEIRQIIEKSIFDLINANQLYPIIAKTQFMNKFVKYLVMQDRIGNLLNTSLNMNRFADAIQLFRVYFKFHPHDTNANFDDLDLVETYHKIHSIENYSGLIDFLKFEK